MAREGGNAIRAEEADVVADRNAELVAIDPGQGRHDVDRGVRDQRRPVIGQKRPVFLEEFEQIWHLLEVGRNVRVVAAKMNIVEMNVDDALDTVAEIALR